jgi:hypothetical protein
MKKILLYVALLSVIGSAVFAQSEQNFAPKSPKFYLGAGMGFDYGGIFGGKIEYLPVKNAGVFAGAGFNPLGLGWNVGGSFKFNQDKRLVTNLLLMYGSNGTIAADDYYAEKYEMVSYGVTGGISFDFKVGRKNKLSAGLLVPIRSKKFRDNHQNAKDDPDITLSTLLPIGVCLGFSFGI